MPIRTQSDIKRSQKEKLLLRTITELYHAASQDDKDLQQAYVTRVQLSPSKSMCTVYFYMPEGETAFKQISKKIALYKPSMRKALAHEINSRYTCELAFRFDAQFEKTEKLERLFLKVAQDDAQYDTDQE